MFRQTDHIPLDNAKSNKFHSISRLWTARNLSVCSGQCCSSLSTCQMQTINTYGSSSSGRFARPPLSVMRVRVSSMLVVEHERARLKIGIVVFIVVLLPMSVLGNRSRWSTQGRNNRLVLEIYTTKGLYLGTYNVNDLSAISSNSIPLFNQVSCLYPCLFL